MHLVDGIDVAVVDITQEDGQIKLKQIAFETVSWDKEVRKDILKICSGAQITARDLTGIIQ